MLGGMIFLVLSVFRFGIDLCLWMILGGIVGGGMLSLLLFQVVRGRVKRGVVSMMLCRLAVVMLGGRASGVRRRDLAMRGLVR